MDKKSNVFRGALLIAGTSIGGGILGLPIEMGLGGFIPSIVIYIFCWVLMACTGLLFLEVTLWMKKGSNIISMAKETLGRPGELFSWALYIFLFYSLMVAYISGCGKLIHMLLPSFVPEQIGPLLFVLIFAPFIYAGARVVGRLNVVMMTALFLFFLTFVFMSVDDVKPELLTHKNWYMSLIGLPVAFTAFAYQGTIPTLVNYMNHDHKKIRIAIIAGSTIPFVIYIIWQALILGIVPVEGEHGLTAALANDDNAVTPLIHFTNNPILDTVAQFFAFFVMVTSFFGVSLGLLDFLADGFKVDKSSKNRLLLCLVVFIPPLLITLYNPDLFLTALSYAGGYGCALLLGLLPVLMVWSGRYSMGLKSEYALAGGKIVLSLLGLFVIFEVIVQVSIMFGWIGR